MIYIVRSHLHAARLAGCSCRATASTDQDMHTRAMNGHGAPSHDFKPCNTFLQSKGTNIFSMMTQLSVQHNSVNLGQVGQRRSDSPVHYGGPQATLVLAGNHMSNCLLQGFPDEEGPVEMKKRAGAAILEHHNQYPPMHGIPELRQVLPRTRRYGWRNVYVNMQIHADPDRWQPKASCICRPSPVTQQPSLGSMLTGRARLWSLWELRRLWQAHLWGC